MPNCTNMGVAAALLACLVTTCLMGEAHAYSCSTNSDCAYKGCADVPCNSSSSPCKNGTRDYDCSWSCDWPGLISGGCPDPTLCTAGSYSTNGLDYLGLGACKPCDAGKFSAAGASTCSDCQAGKISAAGASTCSDCQAGKISAAGASTCSDCQAGKISAAGASTCSDCQAGKYAAAGASTLCAHCQAGKMSGAGASTCADCPDGKTANVLSTDCELKVSENTSAAIVGGVVGGVAAILVCIAVMSLPY